MKTTEKKLEKLRNYLIHINEREEGLFDFTAEQSDGLVVIIDHTEEFYYDGFAFDRIHSEIESYVQKLFGENCYLDCECPGRWVIGKC